MQRIKMINLFDSSFAHAHCSTGWKIPKDIKYTRGNTDWDGITVFTDEYIFNQQVDKVTSPVKVAWLIEPEAISPENYQNIHTYINKFDYLITHNQGLLEKYADKSSLAPTAGVWVDDWVSFKNKTVKGLPVSTIYSNKKVTEGHLLRHSIGAKIKNIDKFGSGATPIDRKEEGLSNYYFSIVVENSKEKNYFSEKICDCFATSTIPIYWGDPNIGTFFNTEGILTFSNLQELEALLLTLEHNYKDIYLSKKIAIEENYLKVKKFTIIDDWIYHNILVNLIP